MMDFFTLYYVFGMLTGTPINPGTLPVTQSTYVGAGQADSSLEFTISWESVSANRIKLTKISHDVEVPTSQDTAGSWIDMNPDGTLLGMVSFESNLDFRSGGMEFVYSGGRLAKIVERRNSQVNDSIVMIYQSGLWAGWSLVVRDTVRSKVEYTYSDGYIVMAREVTPTRESVDSMYWSGQRDTLRVIRKGIPGSGDSRPTPVFIFKGGKLVGHQKMSGDTVLGNSVFTYGPGLAIRPVNAELRSRARPGSYDASGRWMAQAIPIGRTPIFPASLP